MPLWQVEEPDDLPEAVVPSLLYPVSPLLCISFLVHVQIEPTFSYCHTQYVGGTSNSLTIHTL